MTFALQSEIEKKRAVWWAEHHRAGMSRDEVFKQNEELMELYPKPQEERAQKAKALKGVPEFVL